MRHSIPFVRNFFSVTVGSVAIAAFSVLAEQNAAGIGRDEPVVTADKVLRFSKGFRLSSAVDGSSWLTVLTDDDFAGTPRWSPEDGVAVPVSVGAACSAALADVPLYTTRDLAVKECSLLCDRQGRGTNWFYFVSFEKKTVDGRRAVSAELADEALCKLQIVVLLSGKTVPQKLIVKSRAEFGGQDR